MIPAAIDDAYRGTGWTVDMFSDLSWFGLTRGDLSIQGRRDRWRHYSGRAYRGDALTAIFRSQREIIEFLGTVS